MKTEKKKEKEHTPCIVVAIKSLPIDCPSTTLITQVISMGASN